MRPVRLPGERCHLHPRSKQEDLDFLYRKKKKLLSRLEQLEILIKLRESDG